MEKDMTRPAIAFAGAGWIGLNRIEYLLREKDCDVVAVYDPDPVNAGKAISLAPAAVLASGFDELLDFSPDGIVIATPSAFHASQAVKALEHGIAVFSHKPLARTSMEARDVINAAYHSDRLLGVDMSYRYTDGMQQIKKQSRDLGKIFGVDLVFNNAWGPGKPWFSDPKLSGGGCLIDLGMHLIDIALWMLGFPLVRNVSSSLVSKGRLIEGMPAEDTAEDYASVQMETENGTIIRLVCSWNLHAGNDAGISASFYGTDGSALFYNVDGSFYDFEAAVCHGTSRQIISSPPDDWGGRAIIQWAETLMQGGRFGSNSWEYYRVAEVIDMIYNRISIPEPAQ